MKKIILIITLTFFIIIKGQAQTDDFDKIYELCKNEQYNEAIPKLYNFISLKPNHIPAHYELAKAYEYKGNTDSSVYFYEATSGLINILFLTTDLRYDEFIEATKDCGTFKKVKCARNYLNQRIKSVKELKNNNSSDMNSISNIKEISAIQESAIPEKKEIKLSEADKYFNQGEDIIGNDIDSEIKSIRKGTPSNKEMAAVYGIEYKEPDYKKAIGFYEKAINSDNKYVNAYYRIGQIYEVQKNTLKANDSYKKACQLNSKFCDDIVLSNEEIKFYENLNIAGDWYQVSITDGKIKYSDKGFNLKLNPKFDSNAGVYYYSTFNVPMSIKNAKADWNRGILSVSGGIIITYDKKTKQFSTSGLSGIAYFMKK